MTIVQEPARSGGRGTANRWFRFRHSAEAVRQTNPWEHENFEEEQARWERSDPHYARICEEVRQARNRGEEASRTSYQDPRKPESGSWVLLVNGVSVALDETARQVSERCCPPRACARESSSSGR